MVYRQIYLAIIFILVTAFVKTTTFSALAQSDANQNPNQQPDIPQYESTNQDPNVSYQGISSRWDVVIEKSDVSLYLPYTSQKTSSNFIPITGPIRVRYNADFSYDRVTFTDKPTLTNVFPGGNAFDPVFPNPRNDANGNVLPPIGLRYPTSYQPDITQYNSLFEFGTEGIFWKNLSSFCSILQQRSIKDATDASPFLNNLQSYGTTTTIPGTIKGSGRAQLINGYVRINNLGNENLNVSIKIGRQHPGFSDAFIVPVTFDGTSITMKSRNISTNFYVGRRWSFYADPKDRFLTGGAASVKLPYNLNFQYSISYYLISNQVFKLQSSFRSFLFNTYVSLRGSDPTDAGVDITRLVNDGKGFLRLSFKRQLSDKDFVYDQFIANSYQGFLVDKNAPIEGIRLNLRQPRRASDLGISGEYFVKNWFGLGGEIFSHRLKNDSQEVFDAKNNKTVILGSATSIDTPYTEITTFAEIIPSRSNNVFSPKFNVEFRQRTYDRPQFKNVTFFADPQGTGETRYREFIGQVYYPINKSFSTDFTVYRRSYNFRNRTQNRLFTFLNSSSSVGISTSFAFRMNQYQSLRLTYGFDTDYVEFNPDIDKAHQLRLSYRVQF